MYKGCTVGVVIPAYNEEGFVGQVITSLPDFVDHVYVVDDCSTDGTWSEIRRAVATITTAGDDSGHESDRGPIVDAIRHDRNQGVGAAIKTGYSRAADDEVDVTAVINGDGQMDPAILDRIIDPVVEGRADYAKGNRLFSRNHLTGMSAFRRFGNATLTFLTKMASGYWKMMDSQNGYTAISLDALQTLDLDALYDDYGFCNDLLVRLNAHQMSIADVEMEAVYGDETSTIEYRRFIPTVSSLLLDRFLWRMKARYIVTDFHPLVGMYLVSVTSMIAGTLGVAKSLLWLPGDWNEAGPSAEFSFEVSLLGIVTAIAAMTMDMKENESLEELVRRDAEDGASSDSTSTTETQPTEEPRPRTDDPEADFEFIGRDPNTVTDGHSKRENPASAGDA